MNKINLGILTLILCQISFANLVWIEKDQNNRDLNVHITIDNINNVHLLNQAFPHGFVGISNSPIDQELSIKCTSHQCEVIYFDEHRSYRQIFDEGIRGFDLNRDLAEKFYDAFGVSARVDPPLTNFRSFERKSFFSTDEAPIGYFWPRLELSCTKALGYSSDYAGPFCSLEYSLRDMY